MVDSKETAGESGHAWIAPFVLLVVSPCFFGLTGAAAALVGLTAWRRHRSVAALVFGLLGALVAVVLWSIVFLGAEPAFEALGEDLTTFDASVLAGVVHSHKNQVGEWPESLEAAGVTEAADTQVWWRDVRVDPWGKPYEMYRSEVDEDGEPRPHLVIRSLGPDGERDTADDLRLEWIPAESGTSRDR